VAARFIAAKEWEKGSRFSLEELQLYLYLILVLFGKIAERDANVGGSIGLRNHVRHATIQINSATVFQKQGDVESLSHINRLRRSNQRASFAQVQRDCLASGVTHVPA
jgi:hypothetical protein